ncbi:MAG: threonine--tRNA ligase, partial [Caldisericia bacterium]|nr:threonine--tRNA ligase [Caldisericia bacterium]
MKIEIYIENFSLNFSIEDDENLFHLLNLLSHHDNPEFVGAIINGDEVVDFYYTPKDKDKIKFLTILDQEALDILNHSTSHILAYAVKSLYKDAKLAIGPSIKNGFYYD